eukprot:TRINITY_DN34164_c0_g1_i1.p1 TRINITY_DN34164_c0_g1~~TRINITY_DN34164_c0_g1_i1.p1  ORF type:complete len:761 (-),score=189.76 TRINITY_DN34164_c0_g1_i1:75-2357(-)
MASAARGALLILLVASLRAAADEVEAQEGEGAEAASGAESELGIALPWTWSRISAEGVRPARRQGHAAVELGQRIYIIGGCKQDVLRCYDDVHIFDTDYLRWLQEPLRGAPPEARGGHSATLVGTDIIVYGGANSEETFGNVYRLDPVKRRWSRVIAVDQRGGDGPGRRTGHAAAADRRGRVYVFGGYDASGNFMNDMWFLQIASTGSGGNYQEQLDSYPEISGTWTQPASTGPVPAARSGHTFTYIDRKLVLFGGYTEKGRAESDVHAYDPEAQHWMRLDAWGPPPSSRYAHSAVRHGHDLVVAGGCDVSDERAVCFSDVWSLNLNDLRWSQRSTDAVTWFPREGHSAVFVRGRMFAFGGCELKSQCFNDLVALDTQLPCPNSCGHHGLCMNELFCRCTVPGWSGHDCEQPLVCAADCGPHGACAQSGHCVCENGWTGPTCSLELGCPSAALSSGGRGLECGGRGLCMASGMCKCVAGYTGAACEQLAPEAPPGLMPMPGVGGAAAPAGLGGDVVSAAQAWRASGGIVPVHMVATVVADAAEDAASQGTSASSPPLRATPMLRAAKTKAAAPPPQQQPQPPQPLQSLQRAPKQAPDLPPPPPGMMPRKQALLQQRARQRRGARERRQRRAEDEPVNPFASKSEVRGHAKGRIQPKDRLEGDDFGVTVNEDGVSGVDHECPDSCNFRGLCDNAECFCQPGYFGAHCEQSNMQLGDTIDLPKVMMAAAIAGGVGAVAMLLMMLLKSKQPQETEVMMKGAPR